MRVHSDLAPNCFFTLCSAIAMPRIRQNRLTKGNSTDGAAAVQSHFMNTSEFVTTARHQGRGEGRERRHRPRPRTICSINCPGKLQLHYERFIHQPSKPQPRSSVWAPRCCFHSTPKRLVNNAEFNAIQEKLMQRLWKQLLLERFKIFKSESPV